jgi:hypothetical protein
VKHDRPSNIDPDTHKAAVGLAIGLALGVLIWGALLLALIAGLRT